MGNDPATHWPMTDQKQREENNSLSDLWLKMGGFDPFPMAECEVCDIDHPIYVQLLHCISPLNQTELTTSSDLETGSSVSSNSTNVMGNAALN